MEVKQFLKRPCRRRYVRVGPVFTYFLNPFLVLPATYKRVFFKGPSTSLVFSHRL